MIIPQKVHDEFILIKSAFENHSIRKMSELEKQKPTRIAQLIGMNQGRYGAKLLRPENFSPSEIIRLSIVLDVDAGLIINVIKSQLQEAEMKRITNNLQKINNRK
jgi:hypothetical protein